MHTRACARRCHCDLDGLGGDFCEAPLEQTCMNQCSGRGACYLGFCKCHAGWYGHDCALRAVGAKKGDRPGARRTHAPERMHAAE